MAKFCYTCTEHSCGFQGRLNISTGCDKNTSKKDVLKSMSGSNFRKYMQYIRLNGEEDA